MNISFNFGWRLCLCRGYLTREVLALRISNQSSTWTPKWSFIIQNFLWAWILLDLSVTWPLIHSWGNSLLSRRLQRCNVLIKLIVNISIIWVICHYPCQNLVELLLCIVSLGQITFVVTISKLMRWWASQLHFTCILVVERAVGIEFGHYYAGVIVWGERLLDLVKLTSFKVWAASLMDKGNLWYFIFTKLLCHPLLCLLNSVGYTSCCFLLWFTILVVSSRSLLHRWCNLPIVITIVSSCRVWRLNLLAFRGRSKAKSLKTRRFCSESLLSGAFVWELILFNRHVHVPGASNIWLLSLSLLYSFYFSLLLDAIELITVELSYLTGFVLMAWKPQLIWLNEVMGDDSTQLSHWVIIVLLYLVLLFERWLDQGSSILFPQLNRCTNWIISLILLPKCFFWVNESMPETFMKASINILVFWIWLKLELVVMSSLACV